MMVGARVRDGGGERPLGSWVYLPYQSRLGPTSEVQKACRTHARRIGEYGSET